MSSPRFNWSSLICEMADESFGVPHDVIFQIVEEDQVKEVKAHKMILGMISPMFKKMFFTTDVGDKTAKEIEIKETTSEAFQIMIDAIYGTKTLEESLKGKPIHDIFDVVNLIERYQIAELEEVIEEHIENYTVTDDTVLDVASEALQYSAIFQKESQHLLLICARFLKPKLTEGFAILKYISDHEDEKEVVSTLLAKIYKIYDEEEATCDNCGYWKGNCQNRKPVKEDEFKEGMLVTNNRTEKAFMFAYDRGTGKVTGVTDTEVTVATFKKFGDFDGDNFPKTFNGIPTFLFSCNRLEDYIHVQMEKSDY